MRPRSKRNRPAPGRKDCFPISGEVCPVGPWLLLLAVCATAVATARPYDNVACSGVSSSDWAGSHRYFIELDGDFTQKLLLKPYTAPCPLAVELKGTPSGARRRSHQCYPIAGRG